MKSDLVKGKIQKGEWNPLFLELYADETKVDYQVTRYIDTIQRFENYYGEKDIHIFSAPGRSEIGGNHTDHQHGQILAASINLDAIAVVALQTDDTIRLISGESEELVIDLKDLEKQENEKGTTIALVKGVLYKLQQWGFRIGGFCAYITSDVLIGAGLSSSAAFEILIGTIISGLFNENQLDPVKNAMVGQYAENEYFGKPCGLMDQMACSVGGMVYVDFKDVTNPIVQKVDFDLNTYAYSLCITDTKGSHADLTDEYAAVPAEMKAVAGYFGKDVLVNVSFEQVLENIVQLREKFGDRAILRTLHFIEENQRVTKEVEVLEKGQIEVFLQLVEESGNSSYKYLQNVYTNKDVSQQNVSIALAFAENALKGGAGVCRVHGGGFAGTMQAIVKNDKVMEYAKTMDRIFGEGACKVLKIRKDGGCQVI